MKIFFTITISLLLLCSCNNQDIGKERMDTFIEKYRGSFVKSDLALFRYDSRSKFDYRSKSFEIPIYTKKGGKIKFKRGAIADADTTDKIQKLLFNYLNFIEENKDSLELHNFCSFDWLAKDAENSYVLINDSNEVFELSGITFDFDPIEYFFHLESLIHRFEILSIKGWGDEVKIIFDSKNSLIYFPNKPSVEDTLNMNYEMIDDFWYKDYNETNTDYW